jgi:hypothetical protein
MENIFQGIGTEIIGVLLNTVLSLIVGGAVGYRIGVSSKQKQKAGNNSNQVQNSINFNGNVTAKNNMNIGSVSDDK